MKDNKSLTSSKPEIRYEDHLIHLPTKLKKISRLSQDHNEDRVRGALFIKNIQNKDCTHYLINTKLYMWNTFFNLFDFLQLRKFCVNNIIHTCRCNFCTSTAIGEKLYLASGICFSSLIIGGSHPLVGPTNCEREKKHIPSVGISFHS